MKPYLLLLVFLLAGCVVKAQQNSPVAGQASILSDLLKKNYGTIDPDLREDEVVKDRAQVISIFRSFLQDKVYAGTLADLNALATAMTNAKMMTTAYTNAKRLYNTGANVSISVSTDAAVKAVNKAAISRDSVYAIARTNYYITLFGSDNAQLTQLQTQFNADGDLFVGDVLTLFLTKYQAINDGTIDVAGSVNPNGNVTKALSFTGGAWDNSAVIIDALSQFLAKRIKQELMTFAVQNIQTWLTQHNKQTPYEELMVLFPGTTAYLMKFDADKVTSFPGEIKQYIENDLNNLMDNGYNLKNTTLFQNIITAHPEVKLAFEAFHLVPSLSKVKYPSDLISMLNSSRLMAEIRANPGATYKDIGASMNLLELISNSLTITTNGEPQYTTINFWGTYGRDISFMKLYVGFLYEQNIKYYNVVFTGGDINTYLGTFMAHGATAATLPTRIATVQTIMTDICKNAEDIYNQEQSLRKLSSGGRKLGADTIYSFGKSIISFTRDLSVDADKLVIAFSSGAAVAPGVADKMKPYLALADTANDAVRNIADKKYAEGVLELLEAGLNVVPNGSLKDAIEYSRLITMSATTANAAWAQWSVLRTMYAAPAGIVAPYTQAQANAAALVNAELNKITTFYNGKAAKPDNSLLKLIGDAQIALITIKVNLKPDASKLSAVSQALGNADIQEIVASYYLNFMISDAASGLAVKMQAFIDQGNSTLSPLVTQAAVSAFVQDMQDYSGLFYNSMIAGGTPASPAMVAKEASISALITDFTTGLPKAFGYQLDPRLVSLIHFINDMALAKTSDDVEQAIEALALPAGSYSIKQSSVYTISVNSFPGILGGLELTNTKPFAGTVGFTAPVGFDITWGHAFWKTWTLGVFVPLIDVGAVTRLRIDQDDNTQTLPDLSWKNVFSPGAFLCVGIGKTPFSINFGGQYGPEIKDTQSNKTYSSWRIGAGITIDIPLFNIYNKPISN